MRKDFLIAGGGLAGSLLARELHRRGKSLLLADNGAPQSSSRICGGVINPVTGWRMVQTWHWEKLRPAFTETYGSLELESGRPLLHQKSILTFYPDPEGLQILLKRSDREEGGFLHGPVPEERWQPFFNFHFGIGEIAPAWTVDVPALLAAIRRQLIETDSYLETAFNPEDVVLNGDGVCWKNIRAKQVVFCRGIADAGNPFFPGLPFAGNKGEALIVRIPGLPREAVFRQGLSLVPWQSPDLWWAGTTHELNYTDALPTAAFRQRTEAQLKTWLKSPFETVDHLAAERPTTTDRRPILGTHPLFPQVAIFNGLGTKGCSLAPYFAAQLADQLCEGKPPDPAVDVARFSGILRRMAGR